MADATTVSYKVIRSAKDSKGPELPQQMESALNVLLCNCKVISPVQFIVLVNPQVLVRCHHLNVRSLDVHRP